LPGRPRGAGQPLPARRFHRRHPRADERHQRPRRPDRQLRRLRQADRSAAEAVLRPSVPSQRHLGHDGHHDRRRHHRADDSCGCREADEVELQLAAMTTTAARAVPKANRRVAGSRSRSSIPRFAGRGLNLLYLPALAVLGVFTLWPLVNGVMLSLSNWDGYSPERSFVGLENYLRLFDDPNFRRALGNTFIYGVGSTILQQVIGLALALALDRSVRGRNVARAIIYLPVLVSPVVMGTMYYLFLSYNSGGLNDLVIA